MKKYKFYVMNINGYTPEKIAKQEQFIINSLKIGNCK